MKEIKIGFIGLGCRGGDLLYNVVLKQNETVTAVCDVYEDRAQGGADTVAAAEACRIPKLSRCNQ